LCIRVARTAPDAAAASLPGGAYPVAARRRRRRLQTALDHAFGTDVLTLFEDDGGHALVPAHDRAGGPPPELPEGLAERLRHACRAEVRIAAVPAADPAAVPQAARTAAEVVRVARAAGHP